MYIPIVREEVATIGFIASEYPPNVDAIRFFIQNCWPEIIAIFEVSLNIYGNVCRFVPSGIRNVNLKGHILDQQQAYKECDIMINPVRFGAGLNIKNIEALASGLPLLTTTHGSRGLEEVCGTAFLCADSSTELIRKIKELITNAALRKALSSEALKFAEHFTAEKCFAPLLEVINGI